MDAKARKPERHMGQLTLPMLINFYAGDMERHGWANRSKRLFLKENSRRSSWM